MAGDPTDVLVFFTDDGSSTERVSHRKPTPIEIVEYDPAWPARYAEVEKIMREALGEKGFVSIQHVGSTSVPGLLAKNVLDIDLIVPDIQDEAAYVPALEAAGFQLLFREPAWYEHRFFGFTEPRVNLHVFGPECAEVKRHRLFRDWLRTHDDDRDAYAAIKREAALASGTSGENIMQYTKRKEPLIQSILRRCFIAEGLAGEDYKFPNEAGYSGPLLGPKGPR
ncbi:GrpB domain protein [Xylariaceae sp. FL0255]|nr:GrpB domain protein [Xylariaceae sp. FL0255]